MSSSDVAVLAMEHVQADRIARSAACAVRKVVLKGLSGGEPKGKKPFRGMQYELGASARRCRTALQSGDEATLLVSRRALILADLLTLELQAIEEQRAPPFEGELSLVPVPSYCQKEILSLINSFQAHIQDELVIVRDRHIQVL